MIIWLDDNNVSSFSSGVIVWLNDNTCFIIGQYDNNDVIIWLDINIDVIIRLAGLYIIIMTSCGWMITLSSE
jgi:hypothetical protein